MATVTTHKHVFTAKKSPRLLFIAECFRLKNVRTAQTFRSRNTCGRREDSEDREPRIARMKMFSREKICANAAAEIVSCFSPELWPEARTPFLPATPARPMRQFRPRIFAPSAPYCDETIRGISARSYCMKNFRTFVVANKRHEP